MHTRHFELKHIGSSLSKKWIGWARTGRHFSLCNNRHGGSSAHLQVPQHLGSGGLEEELHGELEVVVYRIKPRGHRQQLVVVRVPHKCARAAVQRRPRPPGPLGYFPTNISYATLNLQFFCGIYTRAARCPWRAWPGLQDTQWLVGTSGHHPDQLNLQYQHTEQTASLTVMQPAFQKTRTSAQSRYRTHISSNVVYFNLWYRIIGGARKS